jgi:hypothetical protein
MIAFLNSIPTPLWSFLLGLAATFIAWIARPRTKIVWSKTHAYCHTVFQNQASQNPTTPNQAPQPLPPLLVYNEYFVVGNRGRKTAEQIEIVFNFKPQTLSIWPQRNYREMTNPEGRYNLAPRENFNVNVLQATSQPPELLAVRTPDRVGKQIRTQVFPVYPNWVLVLVWLMIFLGVCVCIYGALRLATIVYSAAQITQSP